MNITQGKNTEYQLPLFQHTMKTKLVGQPCIYFKPITNQGS